MALIKVDEDTLKLVVEMADESAIGDIESFCRTVKDSIGRILWYDATIGLGNDGYKDFRVERAIRYLTMRKRLRVNQKNPSFVKPR